MGSQALSNYDRAFTLLKENPLEQRLDVQLPYEKFLQLDEAFSELKSAAGISEGQRYPSLAYNSHTETVTVVTGPAASTKAQDSGSIPRSKKKSQMADFFMCGMDGEDKLLIALEVGYSEVYGKLLDDKDMWIDGKGADVVILYLIQDGLRLPVDDLPVTFGLRMRDLYPRDEWEAANVEDCIIPFEVPDFWRISGLASLQLRRTGSKDSSLRYWGYKIPSGFSSIE
ncbi:hypothetical protein V1508DRAFT_399160 [Lipomyces doorenjongii]|uniref:uncharacterized protein n=1 Tax=Lipomyces doorenjongii TaxID=383834 RepID=UPI0034CEC779